MYNPYNPEANNNNKTFNETVRNFKKHLMIQKISSGSIRSYLSDTRFFFNWLIRFLEKKHILLKIDRRNSKLDIEVRKSIVENETSNFQFQDPTSNFYSLPSILKFVNEAILNVYKNSLETNNTPIKTMNRRFSALRKFGSFCLSQNWTTQSPFDTLRNISPNTSFLESSYHLGEFKANLWKNNSTKLTIKNYLCDAKQFINWINTQKI